jgi:hypothetical protein
MEISRSSVKPFVSSRKSCEGLRLTLHLASISAIDVDLPSWHEAFIQNIPPDFGSRITYQRGPIANRYIATVTFSNKDTVQWCTVPLHSYSHLLEPRYCRVMHGSSSHEPASLMLPHLANTTRSYFSLKTRRIVHGERQRTFRTVISVTQLKIHAF